MGTVIKGLRKKVGGYMAVKREEYGEIAKVRRAEAQKQRITTALHREKIRGEQRRKYISAGGLGGELRRGFGGAAQAFGGSVVGQPRLARVKRKKKAKKKSKRKK